MLLHNYCQKTYRFAIERFHAMWKFRVKIDTVALVEDDFFAFDVEPKANDEPIHYNQHNGQEFNLVIEGRMLINIEVLL